MELLLGVLVNAASVLDSIAGQTLIKRIAAARSEAMIHIAMINLIMRSLIAESTPTWRAA